MIYRGWTKSRRSRNHSHFSSQVAQDDFIFLTFIFCTKKAYFYNNYKQINTLSSYRKLSLSSFLWRKLVSSLQIKSSANLWAGSAAVRPFPPCIHPFPSIYTYINSFFDLPPYNTVQKDQQQIGTGCIKVSAVEAKQFCFTVSITSENSF